MINIVLLEPEIPQNTGNIVRTCVATGSRLHLIEPLGFSIDDKSLKRAGLDYWSEAEIFIYKNIEDFYSKNSGLMYYATTKGQINYCDAEFIDGCYIFFGKETAGINEDILYKNYDKCIRIPMVKDTRSLNLANSVAIVLYEALRQNNFKDFNLKGHLRKYRT
jgi:tRNA (cytidine/uridine-2'-O-)-methyltransferase